MIRLLKFLVVIFVAIFCVIAYARKVEPAWLDVVQVPVTLPHLAQEFEGYRIVQVTDIHADQWMTRDRLADVVTTINQQHPDAVMLTGDFVTKAAEKYAPTLQALADLQPKDGSFAVLGNHDQWTKPKLLTETLQSIGIDVLKNQFHTIYRGNSELQIAGVGDVWAKQDDLPAVLQQLPIAGAAIMLAHEPDFADETAATGRFDLQLSGHSHGGQVYLPFYKRVTPPLGRKYPIGQYQVGSLIQYTSRGVGMARPRLRFNCRPEVTVLTLHAAPAAT